MDRPIIADITRAHEDHGAVVTITLESEGKAHRGAAIGSRDRKDAPRLVGEAALRAIESMTGGRVNLDLLAIATTGVGDARVAVAQVQMRPFEEVMVGSALLRDDDPDGSWAAARAVMDALNRRLGHLL